MINIYLSSIHCDEETDAVGNDEPYVLLVAVALTPSVQGIPIQAPISSTSPYPFREMIQMGAIAGVSSIVLGHRRGPCRWSILTMRSLSWQ